MIVKDAMTPGNLVRKVRLGQTISEASTIMKEHKVSALPVVNNSNKLVGIISRRDLETKCDLECRAQGFDFAPLDFVSVEAGSSPHGFASLAQVYGAVGQAVVDEIMTKDVITAREDEALTAVIRRMAQHQINHVPIVDRKDELRGIIARADIIKAVSQSVQ